MPLISVDVSVFSSDTRALGNATGDLLLDKIPDFSAEFPWPPHIKASHPAYFTGPNATIEFIGVHRMSQDKTSVSLTGIACSSEAEARHCSEILESLGLYFYEYPPAEA
jgi:hypothetical protein